MPFRHAGDIPYFVFDIFRDDPLMHGVFTRRGGTSPAPWESLNLGGSVGDDPLRVRANKQRVLDALGRSESSLFEVWQMHTDRVVVAERPRQGDTLIQADAIITRSPDVTLLMRFADCVPILLYDERQHAIGMVHAGWLGTVRKAAVAAVKEMGAKFNSRPQDLRAGIGPSIGPDHYPVGADVLEQVELAFGQDAASHMLVEDGQVNFDLWSANRALLQQAGVRMIEVSGVCTACHPEDWYSHRGEKGRTGRFGAAIALQ